MKQGLKDFFVCLFVCKDSCHPESNTPGQEGLVLFYRVQLVGGGVTSLAWKLFLGVFARTGTRDVDVAAAEVAAALQGGRG